MFEIEKLCILHRYYDSLQGRLGMVDNYHQCQIFRRENRHNIPTMDRADGAKNVDKCLFRHRHQKSAGSLLSSHL